MGGAALTEWGGLALIAGTPVGPTSGSVAVATLSIVVLAMLTKHLEKTLGAPWFWWGLGGAVYLAALVTLLRLCTHQLGSIPALPVFGVGVAVMFGSAAWATRAVRSPLPDLVVRPGQMPPRRDLRRGIGIQVLGIWLLPVLILGLLASTWLTNR